MQDNDGERDAVRSVRLGGDDRNASRGLRVTGAGAGTRGYAAGVVSRVVSWAWKVTIRIAGKIGPAARALKRSPAAARRERHSACRTTVGIDRDRRSW